VGPKNNVLNGGMYNVFNVLNLPYGKG